MNTTITLPDHQDGKTAIWSQSNEHARQEQAALGILQSTGVSLIEAALIAKTALEAGRGQLKRTQRCIAVGKETLRCQEQTVSFATAVTAALEARKDKRTRTQNDFRYIARRFMKRCPGLASRRIRSITPHECNIYIATAFNTARQQKKARLILSGIFGTAQKRGWCHDNPVSHTAPPRVKEKPISILKPSEISTLLQAAAQYEGGKCLAAVAMMLYAGIRPHEIARMCWKQVNLPMKCISILPRHSKTGGARLVTIHPPLEVILQRVQNKPDMPICPPQWSFHWQRVRQLAGWHHHCLWTPDILRHTFASYHLMKFRSFSELQLEMGHRDSSLLRSRYLCMAEVINAAHFWDNKSLSSLVIPCIHRTKDLSENCSSGNPALFPSPPLRTVKN